MLRNHPDRIRIVFDATVWWPMPACSCRPPRPTPGPGGTRRGSAPGRANAGDKMMTLVASALAGGDCSDAMRCAPVGRPVFSTVEGAIHPGHLPAQLPLGPCPSAGPGDPGTAGPGLGRRGGTRRRGTRSGLHHLPYGLAKEGARHHGYTGKRGYPRCWPWPPAPATC